jgi:hypothetical protein
MDNMKISILGKFKFPHGALTGIMGIGFGESS